MQMCGTIVGSNQVSQAKPVQFTHEQARYYLDIA